MNNSIKAAAKTMAAVIAAGAMAVAPVAGTINFGAMTAMAETTGNATVQITGLASGDTVRLYRIVGWDATNVKWAAESKYSAEEVSIDADGSNLKVAMSSVVSKINTAGTTSAEATGNANESGTYTSKNLSAGVYIAMVTPANSTDIYNPMIVSVSNGATGLDGGILPVVTNGSIATIDGQYLADETGFTDKAYAKKSSPSLTKKITNPDGNGQGVKTEDSDTAGSKVTGDDLQVGDSQTFTITVKVPDYRGFNNLDASKLTFTLDDNQDTGFNKPTSDPTIKIGDATVDGKYYTLTYGHFANEPTETTYGNFTAATENGAASEDFQIKFNKDFLLANPGATVTVVYSSVLNNTATQGTVANDNVVKLTYTNSNQANPTTGELTGHTYDYSFPVTVIKADGSTRQAITGQDSENDRAAFTIERQQLNTTTNKLETYTGSTDHAVYPTNDTVDKNTVTVGKDDGKATFNHLDEGFYKITEARAPKGYNKTTNPFYIKISTTYNNNDGTLARYTISYVDETGTEFATGTKTPGSFENNTLTVYDTPLQGLPSTGARSALILTIAGIAVMITVMAASRRKKIAD